AGAKTKEPELSVATLEKAQTNGTDTLLRLLEDETGRSVASLEKALAAELPSEELPLWRAACQNDLETLRRIRPWTGLVPKGAGGIPVVIPRTAVYVTSGTDRRSTGTYYTPPSLTEPIVKQTLAPLVFEGPKDGRAESEWELKAPQALLSLRVCDLAMGSGAF